VSEIPPRLRWTGIVLRTAFIGLLVVLIWRVSQPQSETVWSAYKTPGDLVRLALGLVACLWMVIQVFRLPKDAEAYRIWVYLGLIGIPLALLLVAIAW
jgi:TRAP-type C4-dicarboxylate transport system permease small subunit